ncbi:hypothetical protein N7490_003091 [Penicillium lividum]|nr:hypothetical protein N7490_003091 [Penicillium lividum]
MLRSCLGQYSAEPSSPGAPRVSCSPANCQHSIDAACPATYTPSQVTLHSPGVTGWLCFAYSRILWRSIIVIVGLSGSSTTSR